MLFLIFFAVNLFFVTYVIDVEQLVIADPSNFVAPMWPPQFMLEAIHWYGRTFDPLLMARPVWWKATIWIDAIYFGPFYAVALYALYKRKNWIRVPALVWAGMMLSNVIIILFEEIGGPHASPKLANVLLANAAWLSMPLLLIYWMRRDPF